VIPTRVVASRVLIIPVVERGVMWMWQVVALAGGWSLLRP
jgi:hypothetical protein